ncbi:hypothetical protein [Legionella impletisoli]|uniref:Uncharacterized protein n=1 Tax=Legionella impletisoli TaxID=343510 RepID=A0A917NAH7_9GAMM|nr:hypothetical protein [Legionella impletisoli]GGI82661.1 hypothetical protein GCM10007966_09110 [Legionella impletisoli]
MNQEQFEIARINTLLHSRAVETDSLFAESAFIEILIRLNDLLNFLNSNGKRIKFTEDVDIQNGVNDITALVRELRNAACHVRSGNRRIDTNNFVFNRFIGDVPNGINMGEIVMGCNYKDDIALYYGPYRIYLNRHIRRLVNEVSNLLK